jgi:hypothetical protein
LIRAPSPNPDRAEAKWLLHHTLSTTIGGCIIAETLNAIIMFLMMFVDAHRLWITPYIFAPILLSVFFILLAARRKRQSLNFLKSFGKSCAVGVIYGDIILLICLAIDQVFPTERSTGIMLHALMLVAAITGAFIMTHIRSIIIEKSG